MGATERVETEFRKTIWRERKSRKWSQAHMAKLLSDKGLTIYPSTVAKIEAGERAARIDELAAFADLFNVSVDTLLGHPVTTVNDKRFVGNALAETAQHTLWQLELMKSTLGDRANDLAAFNPRGDDKAVLNACERACDALADAAAALQEAQKTIRKIQHREFWEDQRGDAE